jgi:hypothetical protein
LEPRATKITEVGKTRIFEARKPPESDLREHSIRGEKPKF